MADLAFARPSFSQFGEDLVILELVGHAAGGRYVDVGAFDPYHLSNTTLLHRRGWRGINIEPVPAHHAALVRGRPGDINLNLAVDLEPGTVELNVAGTFSGVVNADYLWGPGQTTVEIQARPLSDILAEHLEDGDEIGLLTVDCEGNDVSVLRSHDWSRWTTKIVAVEMHEDDEIAALLHREGFRLHARVGLTGIFVSA